MTSRLLKPVSITQQAGLTLVELMVALALGVILVGAASYAYVSGKQGFRTQDAVSRLQENARTSFEMLTYDIRQAGSSGCLTNNATSALSAGIWYQEQPFGASGLPLVGYEDASSTAPSTDSLKTNIAAGDALAVLRADTDAEYKVTAYSGGTFTVDSDTGFAAGQLIVVTDCNNTWVGQVNSASGTSVTVGTAPTSPFSANSRLYRLSANIYHLRASSAGNGNALYVQSLAAGPATTANEIVDGIEDMQILYGVDTDPTADGSVNQYVSASDVASLAITGVTTNAGRWARVLSVRIGLLMVSASNEKIVIGDQALVFPGWEATPTTYTDGRLRRTFTTTIAIRNRL